MYREGKTYICVVLLSSTLPIVHSTQCVLIIANTGHMNASLMHVSPRSITKFTAVRTLVHAVTFCSNSTQVKGVEINPDHFHSSGLAQIEALPTDVRAKHQLFEPLWHTNVALLFAQLSSEQRPSDSLALQRIAERRFICSRLDKRFAFEKWPTCAVFEKN